MAAGSCLPSVHVNLPRIVAAADGCIQYIVDRNSKQRSPNADECYNNYVWIKHAQWRVEQVLAHEAGQHDRQGGLEGR